VEERLADETERKKFLEDEVREAIPIACDVELTKPAGMETFLAGAGGRIYVKVTGWVSGAGRRALLPVGLFAAPEKHLFDHAFRVHPIYFAFPFQRVDDVSIDMPLVGRSPRFQRRRT